MMNKQTGFTLIEIMIVVCIIGILAAIAYPSYTSSIQKSRRADAQGALMSFAGAMERHFTVANNYCDVGTDVAVESCGDDGTPDTGAPTIFSTKSPVDSDEAYYDLTISNVTANSFELSATPVNQQINDPCGTLILTNTGVRSSSLAPTNTDCW